MTISGGLGVRGNVAADMIVFPDGTTQGTASAGGTVGPRNKIINGNMVIDQRNEGAVVTAGSSYTLDRWNVDLVWSGSTVTVQRSSSAPGGSGFANSMFVTVSTGAAVSSANYFSIQQFIEGYNIMDLELGSATPQSFTVSFWVRSSVTGTYGIGFRNSDFTLSYWTTYTVIYANTWERKVVTVTGSGTALGAWYKTNSYGLNLIFSLGCGSTNKATSNNSWNVSNSLGAIGQTDLITTTGAIFALTGVQLEKGTTATSFEYRPYVVELQLCQRYYQIINRTANRALYSSYGSSFNWSLWQFKVTMRSSPTIAGAGQGLLEGSTPDFATRYSAGNAYASFGYNGSTYAPATATAEL